MSSSITLAPALRTDVEDVCRNLRDEDIQEVRGMLGTDVNVSGAIMNCWLVSRDTSFVAFIRGTAFCIFGVKVPTLLGGPAVPWMVATPVINESVLSVAKASKRVNDTFAQWYPHLRNYVDARNHITIKWLRWLGYTIYVPRPFGPDGVLFHKFEMRAS